MTPLDELKKSFANYRSNRPSPATVERWRTTGCCTECGNPLVGAKPIGEQGVVFFGAPHQAEDVICFWCMERWTQDAGDLSPWPTGHA